MISSPSPKTVIMLHGITQSDRHLRALSNHLQAQGFVTHNIAYKWRVEAFDDILQEIKASIQALSITTPFMMYGHSMGSLVIRALLAEGELSGVQRVVMSGPPNHGSEGIDTFRSWPLLKWIYGPVGLQLGVKGEDMIAKRLPIPFPEEIDLGVIAGSRSSNIILKYILPRPNDGKVSVASTHIPGEDEHIILPLDHDKMIKDPLLFEATTNYLAHGSFQVQSSASLTQAISHA